MSRARPRPGKEYLLAALRREGAGFRAAVADQELDRPVPSCPGWTVGDLIRHLAGGYRWVHGHVTRGVTSAPEQTRPSPVETDDPLGAWDVAYAELVQVLEQLDPEFPAWNSAPAPKRASYWLRRQVHETAIHRWDAQIAAGRPEPIEAPLAVDGVAEVLDTRLPAGRRTGPTDVHGLAELVATDEEQEWYVRLRGPNVALLDTATVTEEDPAAAARASGSASDLVLALWGRVPFDVLQIEGEVALLEALRTG